MDSCFFCGAIDFNGSVTYECISTAKVPSSQKTVSVVLTHLANCIKADISFSDESKVCSRCFLKLSEYDSLMVSLMKQQKKLTRQLKASLNFDLEELDEGSVPDSFVESEPLKLEQDEAEAMLIELVKDDSDSMTYIKSEDDDDDDSNEYVCEIEVAQESVKEESVAELGIVDESSNDKTYTPKIGKHKCSTCGIRYSSKFQLQKHINEVHSKQHAHICPICGVVRRDEEYLELHMNLHEGKTEKQCRYCPKSFSRPVNTLRHMRMHWDKKKYQCEKCGVRFSQDNLLYNHRMRHEAEENPIICSICNVSFKSRKTFNHHTLIHKENRPRHHCSLCPKSFTERYTLKVHMKTHDGDVVYGVREEPSDEQQVVEELHVDVDESEQAEAVADIMSDNDENSGFCVICSSHFESKTELEQHLQLDHEEEDLK